jgi:hypothetical protein
MPLKNQFVVKVILSNVFAFVVLSAFSQHESFFIAPITQYESTQSFGYKPTAKTVSETVNYVNFVERTEREFNKEGYLTSCEVYNVNPVLTQSVKYIFQTGKLIEIEELSDLIYQEDESEAKKYLSATAHYAYDNDNRLISYEVIIEGGMEENSVYHIHYPEKDLVRYYFMYDNDSALVAEKTILKSRDLTTVTQTEYQNGDTMLVNIHVFNHNNDKIEFIIKRKEDGTLKEYTHEYYEYKYDKNNEKVVEKSFYTTATGEKFLYETRQFVSDSKQRKIITNNYEDGETSNTRILNANNQLIAETAIESGRIIYDEMGSEMQNVCTKTTEVKFQRKSTNDSEVVTKSTVIKYLDEKGTVIFETTNETVKHLNYTFYSPR